MHSRLFRVFGNKRLTERRVDQKTAAPGFMPGAAAISDVILGYN